MTKFVLTNVRLLQGGADLSGDTNKAELMAKVDVKDCTNYNSAGWHEELGGLGSATINATGFTEAGSLSLPDDNGFAQIGLLGGVTIAPQGAADQALAYFGNVLTSEYDPIVGSVGDVAGFNLHTQTSGKLVRGTISVPPGTALVASGNGTVTTLGAVLATQKIYASLNIISVSGSPTITFIVQSAATNFASPTTRISFTAATAVGSQFLFTPGAITDTFWRSSWTVSGSGSVLASVAFGIA